MFLLFYVMIIYFVEFFVWVEYNLKEIFYLIPAMSGRKDPEMETMGQFVFIFCGVAMFVASLM